MKEHEGTMTNASYVYPNVSEIPQRGGLLERWQLAKEVGCDYIEMPADFVKNQTEMNKTGLYLGDFPTAGAIRRLYKKDSNIPEELKYILHTEPSLTRRNSYGISHQAPLKWYDKGWVEKFASLVIHISRFLGIPAAAIEIHPGDRRNSFQHISSSIEFLLDSYSEEFNVEPLILVENRTGQCISSGKEILYFWKFLSENYSNLRSKAGIVLDIQQLYTVTRSNFLKELEMIPSESLKGFHIHYRHRTPDLSNPIPWKQCFEGISIMTNEIIINPEIHHKNKVKDAIKFCEGMLGTFKRSL